MITIFDSGIGGLEILRQIRKRLPDAPILYYGDTAFMPYGERTDEEIYERIAQFIKKYEDQTDLFVIACNSATVSMIDDYRKLTDVPFVGVEPGIKPAAEQTKTKSIAVLATPRTIRSLQIQDLIGRYGNGNDIQLIECTALAQAIEREPGQVEERLNTCLAQVPPLADTIVLACTHYSLIKDQIDKQLGAGKHVVDVSDAVADQVTRAYQGLAAAGAATGTDGKIRFECSGEINQFLARIKEVAPDLLE
ncbi:glutamate racemase [Patescibacteria group bacterium]